MIETDFAEFFSGSDFAEPALLDDGRQLMGIFDRNYQSLAGNVVEGAGPAFTTAEAWAKGVARDHGITIRGERYRVVGQEPDGTGELVLKLHRV